MQWDVWGFAAVVFGLLGSLLAYGVILREPRDERLRQQIDEWRKSFGRVIRILGPLLVVLGILRLIGVGG